MTLVLGCVREAREPDEGVLTLTYREPREAAPRVRMLEKPRAR